MNQFPDEIPGLDPQMDAALRAFAHAVGEEVAGRAPGFAERMRARLAGARRKSERPRGRVVDIAAERHVRAPRSRKSWIGAVAATLLLVIAASYLRGLWSPRDPVRFREGGVTLSGVAEQGTLRIVTDATGGCVRELDDGRIVLYINHDSDLGVTSAEEVKLSAGELWVNVRPASGPFRVATDFGNVDVKGTVFGVNLAGEQALIRIERGEVSVENSVGSVTLTPGRRARITGADAAPITEPEPNTLTPDWVWSLEEKASGAAEDQYYRSAHKQTSKGN